ncbi:MAG TPA: TonB-dependent receptor [Thermoanaerobaculaceae bacterium]|nr:TonB-dependent receptor [Thermoanaerobaculaceae bacterium]
MKHFTEIFGFGVVSRRFPAISLALLATVAVGWRTAWCQQVETPPPPAAQETPPTSLTSTIVVTAPRMEVPVKDTPSAVTVVDEKTLKKTESRMIAADEALKLVPGVKVDNQANGERVHLSIRGQGILTERGIRGVKVLQDGLPLGDPTGLTPDLFDVDWATVDRVEVFRGPASSLYGGGGSGGIINITTRDGGPSHAAGDLFASGGSFGFLKGLAESGGAGSLNYRVSASYTQGDGYRVHSAFDATNLYFKFRFDPAPTTQLTVIAIGTDYFNQNAEGLNIHQVEEDPRQPNPDALTFNEYQKTRRGTVGLAGVTRVGAAADLTYSLYYRGTRWEESVPSSVQHRSYGAPGAFVQYTTLARIGSLNHHLSVGTDLDWQNFTDRRYPNLGGAVEGSNLLSDQTIAQAGYAGFLIDRIDLGPAWGVMLSVRYDWIHNGLDDRLKLDGTDLSGTRNFDQTTGRVGVTWNPSKNFGAYAAWGQGFLPPTTEELTNNPAHFGGLNQELVPATSQGGEVGIRGSASGTFAFDVAAFHLTTENDFGRYRIADRPLETFYQNAGSSTRWGIETLLGWRPSGTVAVELAYTWNHFTYDTVTTITGESYTGTWLPNSPAHLAYLDLELRPEPHWVVGLGTEYQSRSYIDPSNTVWTDPYALVNLRAAYQWQGKGHRGEIQGIVRNLFDTEYIAFTEPDPDGNSYHPGPTREAFVGVRFWLDTL